MKYIPERRNKPPEQEVNNDEPDPHPPRKDLPPEPENVLKRLEQLPYDIKWHCDDVGKKRSECLQLLSYFFFEATPIKSQDIV